MRMQNILKKTYFLSNLSQPLSRRKLSLNNHGIDRQAGWALIIQIRD